jgi:hypothetical protein
VRCCVACCLVHFSPISHELGSTLKSHCTLWSVIFLRASCLLAPFVLPCCIRHCDCQCESNLECYSSDSAHPRHPDCPPRPPAWIGSLAAIFPPRPHIGLMLHVGSALPQNPRSCVLPPAPSPRTPSPSPCAHKSVPRHFFRGRSFRAAELIVAIVPILVRESPNCTWAVAPPLGVDGTALIPSAPV